MNLDELRSVQSKERQKDSLQHLRDSFYADVAEYVADRKAARDRAAEEADDPFSSPEVRRLTDEIETAEEVAEAIYERRMGKLVKQASLAAAGMSANEEGLTAEERELFGDLVDRIQANKTHVLDVLSGDVGASPATDADPDPTAASDATPGDGAAAGTPDAGAPDPESPPDGATAPDTTTAPDAPPEAPPGEGVSAADVMGDAGAGDGPAATDHAETPGEHGTVRETDPGEAPPGASGDSARDDRSGADDPGVDPDSGGESEDRVTLRITRDVGQILGVDDREYDLASEDVVSLPAQNAEPLVQRDAAERLE